MDPKFYSCSLPPKTPVPISYFEAESHSPEETAEKECSQHSLQGEYRTVVVSPYTNETTPRYADLSRIDDVLHLIGNSPAEFRYLALDGALSDFDVYIRYRRPAITFASSEEPYQTAFETATFLQIPQTRQSRSDAILNFVKISSPTVDLVYSLRQLDGVSLALALLAEGGDGLFFLEGKFDEKECAQIAICSHAFKRIALFKPVSTSVNATSCYLVCFGFLGDRHGDSTLSASFFRWLVSVTKTMHRECLERSKGKYNTTFLFTACEMQK